MQETADNEPSVKKW